MNDDIITAGKNIFDSSTGRSYHIEGGVVFDMTQYSNKRIDKAGEALVNIPLYLARLEADALTALLDPNELQLEQDKLTSEYVDALQVINNWRSSHQYPLQVFSITLRNRAKGIDPKALITTRTKRLSSIEKKLKRFDKMKLSRMQDIGGCRAIVQSVRQLDKLALLYANSKTATCHFERKRDHIAEPKPDGYRGIHLIYKYHSDAESRALYNDMQIEIQLRSRLQHAWATALESVDTFTQQALKSNIGDERWKRFFVLMGSVIAIKENRPTVENTPTTIDELRPELRDLSEELNVGPILHGWGVAVQQAARTKMGKNARLFLLELHIGKNQEHGTLFITPFGEEETLLAQRVYDETEQKIAGDPETQAVLVSTSSIQALPRAYPNYFLDTEVFIREVNLAIGK